jgi:Domain of unknown function (DUF1877)
MYVCRIDGTAVGKLLSREKSADEYFSECHRVGGSEHDNEVGENVWIDLDKAWSAIHSMLTEGREDRALPTGALLGVFFTQEYKRRCGTDTSAPTH